MARKPDPDKLAADGSEVLPGTSVIPTPEEIAQSAELSEDEIQAAIDAHIAEVDEWKAQQ